MARLLLRVVQVVTALSVSLALALSPCFSSSPASAAPAAPGNLTAIQVNTGRIDLAWTDNSANETGFHITTANDPAFSIGPVTFTVGPNVRRYTDTTVYAGATFYYRVAAFDANGDSAPSNVASVFIPLAVPGIPATPTGLVVAAASSGQITLAWTDTSTGELGFIIGRAADASFSAGLVTFTVGPDVITYSDTSVSAGATYYYRVVAYNSLGSSSPSNVVTAAATVPTPPSAPGNLTATAIATRIDLAWTDTANNESGFRLERATTAAFASPTAFTLTANTNTYSDNSTIAGTTYFYRVFAFNDVGSSTASNTVSAMRSAGGLPAAPSGLTATLVNSGRIDLTWTDNANNENGFHILTATDAAFSLGQVTITAGLNTTQYNDATVYAGATFYYRVTAYNASGDSPASNVASVFIPLAVAGIPPSPTGLTATAVSGNQVSLSWNNSGTNLVGTLLERASNAAFTIGVTTFTVPSNAHVFNDETVIPGTLYYYRATAFNAIGASPVSNIATVTPGAASPSLPTVPLAPTGLSAQASGTGVQLAWADNSINESGFRLERALSANFAAGLMTFNLAPGTIVYSDNSTEAGVTYYYRVLAFNTAGSSNISNVALVMTHLAQPAVTPQPAPSVTPLPTAAPQSVQTPPRVSPASPLKLSGLAGSSSISVDQQGTALSPARLSSQDGKVTINVAAGARLLQANGSALATIQYTAVSSPQAPPADRVILAVWDLGPDGARFDPPITVSIKYEPSALPNGASASELQIAYWEGNQWKLLDSTTDEAASTISIKVPHFSRFSLTAKAKQAAPEATASFSMEGLRVSPRSPRLGEKITISAVVTNNGASSGTHKVVLKIADVEEATELVKLEAGQKRVVSFTTTKDLADTYLVDVNGLSTYFLVSGLPPAPPALPPPAPASKQGGALPIVPVVLSFATGAVIAILLLRHSNSNKKRRQRVNFLRLQK